jgi:hypothetical protein
MKTYFKALFLTLLLACAVNVSAVGTPVKHIIPDSIANRSFGELLTKFGNKQKYKYWQCMYCFGIAEQYYNDTLYLNGHPIVAEWGDSTKYRSIARKELHRTWFHYSSGEDDPSGCYIAAIDTADNLVYIDTDEKFLSFIEHNNITQKIAILTALNYRNFAYSKKDSVYVYYEDESMYYFFCTSRSSDEKCTISKDFKKIEVYSLGYKPTICVNFDESSKKTEHKRKTIKCK